MHARTRNVMDRILVPAAVAVLVVFALSAYAAHGADDDTTFHACVRSGNGALYNVTEDAEPNCVGRDHAISWGQDGPRGPGVVESQADTLPSDSDASAQLEPIDGDPEGDFRLLLGIPQGEQGPPGPTGPQGPQGEPGQGGVTGWEIVTESFTYEDVTEFTEQVNCPDGKIVIGGGASASPIFPDDSIYHLEQSSPEFITDDGDVAFSGWLVSASTTQGSGNAQLVVRVICADVEIDQ